MQAPTTRPLSAATERWWSYARPAIHEVLGSVVDVPVRDAITIACELRRPAHDGVPLDGPFPGLVVEFTPYVVLRDFFVSEADFFASRGYVALVPILRGVGASGGAWEHGSFRQCGRDAHDLVEWLATRPFSDGRVGMFGESFGAQTSYSAAVERPPHLVTIAAMQSPSSLYHDVVFPGGIKSTERGEIDNWPDIANLTTSGVVDADAEFAANRAHPTFDRFWRDRALVDCLDEVAIPVLAIGAGTTATSGRARSPTSRPSPNVPGRCTARGSTSSRSRSSTTQGSRPTSDARSQALADTPQMAPGVLLAWFDHWLAGLPDAPVPTAPTFTSFEGPAPVGGGWREVDGWDPTGDSGPGLTLDADGAVAFHEAVDASEVVDAVSFTSTPLATDQVLVGHPNMSFRATLDADDAHLYFEVFDVDADDEECWVTDGYLAAGHRHSHTDPEPVPVGEVVEYRVGIRAHHHRFCAGHRVRLAREWRRTHEADAAARARHRDFGERRHGRAPPPGSAQVR